MKSRGLCTYRGVFTKLLYRGGLAHMAEASESYTEGLWESHQYRGYIAKPIEALHVY